ncbi:MAG TPA: DUF1059 domain-containing protein [Tepidiformaceae bacterium]|nr:DUF1059 domain-containing protein [Tepidiformaceae bacterium]HMO96702.1 DUF1059 domain-containing protein [Tepidiformaceae bacterium]
MKTRYECREMNTDCGYSCEDERKEVVKREALEHLKTAHPHEALEADRARGTIDAYLRPV